MGPAILIHLTVNVIQGIKSTKMDKIEKVEIKMCCLK